MSGSATLTIELSMTCMSAARTTANAMMYLCGSPRVWGRAMTASLTAWSLAFPGLGGGAPVRGGLLVVGSPLCQRLLERPDDRRLDVVDRLDALADDRGKYAGLIADV